MCIAIASPKGFPIPFAHLQEGFKSNPDGAGFAYASLEAGEVYIEKGFFSFSEFYEAFKNVNGEYDALVHFRWATHGGRNKLNCHPWQIDQSHAMMHNGVLGDYSKFHNGLSDTGNFNETILKPMLASAPGIIQTPWFNKLMGEAIGDGNKVVILNGQGDISIFNEHLGNWRDGVWYSNFDYVRRKKRKKSLALAGASC